MNVVMRSSTDARRIGGGGEDIGMRTRRWGWRCSPAAQRGDAEDEMESG